VKLIMPVSPLSALDQGPTSDHVPRPDSPPAGGLLGIFRKYQPLLFQFKTDALQMRVIAPTRHFGAFLCVL
jgi:hypothetical protein